MVILITGCGDCTWMILVNFVTALAFRCVLMLSCDLRILSLHPPPYCMVSVPEWLKSLSIGPTGEPNAIVFCTVGHTWPGARFSIEVPIIFWEWKAVLYLLGLHSRSKFQLFWKWENESTNWPVCELGNVLPLNRFWFQNLPSDPKSYRAFCKTGPRAACYPPPPPPYRSMSLYSLWCHHAVRKFCFLCMPELLKLIFYILIRWSWSLWLVNDFLVCFSSS